ncbi:protein Dml1p [[Candida] anglica]|uniref:Protein DML1 n=1 Tax=[Candida] anglica TaxID=148631 RepID=A0ABP0ENI3_9ASCO
MHETVTLSLSHSANHVTTHLYNNQESHISYRKGQSTGYDNTVYLAANPTYQGTINYNPRAILYELNGGSGALGKYEYYDPEIIGAKQQEQEEIGNNNSIEIIKSPTKVEKNQYQIALDSGKVKGGLLTVENTKYWSDYNKLIYKPKSLNSLTNWNHDPQNDLGFNKHGKERKFDTFHIGSEEYKQGKDNNEDEDSIELFRSFLEECDLFQGMNILTEVDSAWGGFSNEYLTELKDEYFNNGDSKYSFWIWGLYNCKKPMDFKLKNSRIKTTLELLKNSTLYFPIADPNINLKNNTILNDKFDNKSLWHSSALKSLPIDSLWTITSRLDNPIGMSQIEDDLLRGYKSRNMVSEIKLVDPSSSDQTGANNVLASGIGNILIDTSSSSGSPYDLYANATAFSDSMVPKNEEKSVQYTQPLYEKLDGKYFAKTYIVPTEVNADLELMNVEQSKLQNRFPINEYKSVKSSIATNYTFPDILNNQTSIVNEFGICSKPRALFKDYKKFLERSSRITSRAYSYDVDLDDQSSLIEEANNMIEDYTYEWDDDEDEEDWD